MGRLHVEIEILAELLSGLHGLFALLRLHFVQREENYFTRIPASVRPEPPE